MNGYDMSNFYTNGFTQFFVDGVKLRGMQIANPKLLYQIDDVDCIEPKLIFNIKRMASKPDWNEYYKTPQVGYFERDGKSLYRDVNIISNTNNPEVFYKGRIFPNAFLHVAVSVGEVITVNIEVSDNYLRESRSRISRRLTFDESINNIALACSIRLGILPLHAAAIGISSDDGVKKSAIFMGYPNTGKTTTSVGTRKAVNGKYLSEDICFYRVADKNLLSGPFTLDEVKIQDYTELKSEGFFGGELASIIMLKRNLHAKENRIREMLAEELEYCLVQMNHYEFEWNHDLIVRGLFVGGKDHSFDFWSTSRAYAGMMHQLSQDVKGLELEGGQPEGWAEILARNLLS